MRHYIGQLTYRPTCVNPHSEIFVIKPPLCVSQIYSWNYITTNLLEFSTLNGIECNRHNVWKSFWKHLLLMFGYITIVSQTMQFHCFAFWHHNNAFQIVHLERLMFGNCFCCQSLTTKSLEKLCTWSFICWISFNST